MRARFDRIFRRRTGFVTLDRLLARLHANKAELLMVLDRPEIPLHTNGSENDIRCYVTRRKVSAGTRSDVGRDSRDAFLGLAKTCAKLGIPFWDYLGSRLKVAGHAVVEALDHYVRGADAVRLTSAAAHTFAPLTNARPNRLDLLETACNMLRLEIGHLGAAAALNGLISSGISGSGGRI